MKGWIGSYSVPFTYRIYLREKTVRQLNRERSPQERLPFKTKYQLTREMLKQLKPLLPKEWRVYVLFDSWYASAKLIKFVRRQGKRWFSLGAIKSNRILVLQESDSMEQRPQAQALRLS